MESEKQKLNIKWNGKAIDNIQAVQGEEVVNLKRVIEDTCGVPSKKQKLLFKGKFLKDNDVLEAKMFENGQTIMLMGSAETTDVATHLDPSKIESTTTASSSSNATNETESAFIPTGLKNLGNTCYVNSSLQVLRGLHKSTSLFADAMDKSDTESLEPLANSFISTLKNLEKREEYISPLDFILKLRLKFPQYGEKDKYGLFIQHDVHEFWTSFLSYLNSSGCKLPEKSSILLEKSNPNGEPTYESTGSMLLPVTAETSLLDDCLKRALNIGTAGDENNAPIKIANIPSFLSLVFLRFMWKSNEKVQAKILKLVAYPKNLDIFQYCSETVKADIAAKRASIPEYGNYRLNYVITHTGREADSGHYMAWGRATLDKRGGDDWFKFDDEKVSVVKEEEVMKLGGGGDRPTAYMVVYLPCWTEQ